MKEKEAKRAQRVLKRKLLSYYLKTWVCITFCCLDKKILWPLRRFLIKIWVMFVDDVLYYQNQVSSKQTNSLCREKLFGIIGIHGFSGMEGAHVSIWSKDARQEMPQERFRGTFLFVIWVFSVGSYSRAILLLDHASNTHKV